MQDEALDVIQRDGPVSAAELASRLNSSEKAARSKIDWLRANGITIWHDETLGKFWCDESGDPSSVPYQRWKRRFPGRVG